jgi:hypothetical protein
MTKYFTVLVAMVLAGGVEGCGVLARLGAWNANQYTLAGSSVQQTAIKEHLKTERLLDQPAPSGTALAPSYPTSDRERAARLLAHADAMEELRLENEVRTEQLKQELFEEQVRDASPLSIRGENDRLLREYLP